jgi:hypothetical protein
MTPLTPDHVARKPEEAFSRLTPAEARVVREWNDTRNAAVAARFSPWKPLRQHRPEATFSHPRASAACPEDPRLRAGQWLGPNGEQRE